MTLSATNERDFAAEVGMVTPCVQGLVFRHDVTNVRLDYPIAYLHPILFIRHTHIREQTRKQPGAASMSAIHETAQRIFTGSLLPEKVFIFTNFEGLLSDPSHAEGVAHTAIRDISESWVRMGALTGLFGMGGKEDGQGHPNTLMTSFDYLVPAVTALLSSNQTNSTRAKFFAYGTHDMALLADTGLASPSRLLEGDERFSIFLQEVQTKAKLQGKDAKGENATSLGTAIARFQSTPPDQPSARRTAAVDSVAELLAELLFIPREQVNMEDKLTRSVIDSLVASELRKQLTQYLGINLSTGWILGGDVIPMDIVEVLLKDTNGDN